MTLHESDTLEFKKSLFLIEPALKSVCGFLNHHGGVMSLLRDQFRRHCLRNLVVSPAESVRQGDNQRHKTIVIHYEKKGAV
jgi:hypothetical protein